MCEVLLPDGTPHPSNSRATIPDDPGTWFGFEQEYFLYRDGAPLGFPREGFPAPQGEYYTGVGFKNVGDVAREIVDAHIDLCLEAGINLEGINAEVAKGQWEFQIFGKGSKRAADELWIARYLLLRLCERYGVDVNFHPKPLGMEHDWNGSGMHTNFSTEHMREVGGEEYFEALMAAFDEHKDEHIAVYGPDNHMRLTGLHETQAIDKFNYGVANRGASIRIPHSFVTTATAAISRIAARTRSATRTGSPAGSCRRSRRSRPTRRTCRWTRPRPSPPSRMHKVEAIVIRERVETVIDAVEHATGHVGVTVIEAIGHGRERGVTHEYRGRVFESRFLPKAMLVFVVADRHRRRRDRRDRRCRAQSATSRATGSAGRRPSRTSCTTEPARAWRRSRSVPRITICWSRLRRSGSLSPPSW